jgi:uncharacterized protein with NRDE domain
MCLVLIAYQMHPNYPLVVAANRDEYYERPAAPAAFWQDAPEVGAGRDLAHGGTWLGVSRTGRFAAITNYREPKLSALPHAPSRGELVSRFLRSAAPAEDYLEILRHTAREYNGYNLIYGELGRLYCYSNKNNQAVLLTPGIHGLSNHLLDTPWPKVERGKRALAEAVNQSRLASADLFKVLSDPTPAADDELPDTGIGPELERMLSPIFISSEGYGTRSSTAVLFDAQGGITLAERSFFADSWSDRELRLVTR